MRRSCDEGEEGIVVWLELADAKSWEKVGDVEKRFKGRTIRDGQRGTLYVYPGRCGGRGGARVDAKESRGRFVGSS